LLFIQASVWGTPKVDDFRVWVPNNEAAVDLGFSLDPYAQVKATGSAPQEQGNGHARRSGHGSPNCILRSEVRMTDLVAPPWMDTKANSDAEFWHATVLPSGLIASVIVCRNADDRWTARAQLRDRTLRSTSDDGERGPFASHENALLAGQAAALALQQVTEESIVESSSADASRSPIRADRMPVTRRYVPGQQSRQMARGTRADASLAWA
jgi:hypothetical protein